MDTLKRNIKPIVIISLIFILSRILILFSIFFIRLGPFSERSGIFNWAATESEISLPFCFEKLTVTASSFKEMDVIVFVNDKQVSVMKLDTGKKEYEILLNPEDIKPLNKICFSATEYYIPKEVRPFSIDTRKLSWMLWSITTDNMGVNILRTAELSKEGIYKEVAGSPGLKEMTDAVRTGLTYWDGGHYLSIVDKGYSFNGDFSMQQNVAWPYVYPLLAWLLKRFIIPDSAWSAIAVGNIMLLAGLFIIHRLSVNILGKGNASYLPALLLCFNPFGIFLCAAYSESTFILLSSIGLLMMIQNKYAKSSLFAGASTGVRTVGIVFPFLYAYDFFILKKNKVSLKSIFHIFCTSLISVWGLATFLLYNQVKFGSFLIPFKIQQAWSIDWHRDVIGYVALLARNTIYSVKLLEPDYFGTGFFAAFFIYTVFYFIKNRRTTTRSEQLLVLFSVLIMLIPILNRHNVSFGRFTLTAFPVLILFCKDLNERKKLFLIFYIIFASFLMVIYTMRFACGLNPY